MKLVHSVVVDGWAVKFDTARRGLGGVAARPGPSSLYQMYHPSTASVSNAVLLVYSRPLLRGFNVPLNVTLETDIYPVICSNI